MLKSNQFDAIAHLQCVVGAMLLQMDSDAKQGFNAALGGIEVLNDEQKETVKLFGETSNDISVKSLWQQWTEELRVLEAKLKVCPDDEAGAE